MGQPPRCLNKFKEKGLKCLQDLSEGAEETLVYGSGDVSGAVRLSPVSCGKGKTRKCRI